MKPAILTIAGAGSQSSVFADRLLSSGICFKENKQSFTLSVVSGLRDVIISFSDLERGDFLRIEDLSTLALIVRRLAELGTAVTINYPEPSTKRGRGFLGFLERAGFRELFDSRSGGIWQSQIKITKRIGSIRSDPDSAVAHYIPLRWFTKDDFEFDRKIPILKARPTVSPTLERQFRSVLQTQGFAESETIDKLIQTMFLEIGWNVVIHSSVVQGEGVGVFCAQIYHGVGDGNSKPKVATEQAPQLGFCIADIGLGIPTTLGAAYKAEPDPKRKLSSTKFVRPATDIVYYAFGSGSTSRETHPSDIDKEGFRGLAVVAASIGGGGDLRLRSSGGGARIVGLTELAGGEATAAVDVIADESLEDHPLIGTQVVARLGKPVKLPAPADGAMRAPDWMATKPPIRHACSLDGAMRAARTEETAIQFAENLSLSKNYLVIDLGFADNGPRTLEYLIKTIARRHPKLWVVLWNVSNEWNGLKSLDDWLKDQSFGGFPAPLFVRSPADTRFLGAVQTEQLYERTNPSSGESWLMNLYTQKATVETKPSQIGRRVSLPLVDYLYLNHEVNSSYLDWGFSIADDSPEAPTKAGFFTGEIHLLRGGNPARRYFSLGNNVPGYGESNLRRWYTSCAVAAYRLLTQQRYSDETLVVIGFTGTVREIVARTVQLLRRKCRVYVLLPYDVPTTEEIVVKVRPGDSVLLITDVISSGSLTDAVATLVTNAGASIIGVVSLVDTRMASPTPESTLLVGRHRLRQVSGGHVRNLASSVPGRTGPPKKYYVDPVSLIPTERPSWGWKLEGYQETLEFTLQMIEGFVKCGHIVDGNRHTSVYVDLWAMLQANDVGIRSHLASVLRKRVGERKWTTFAPVVVLYPSGISRIERLRTTDATEPSNDEGATTVYQTAVRAYVDHLMVLWPTAVPVEVPRAFDPSGGARCASTVSLPSQLEVAGGDFIIADDGIWRGTTINGLLQIAFRLGAKRILIAPLLSCLAPQDSAHLENIASFNIRAEGATVDVCYVFPLALPVPYYTAQECPYIVTLN